VLGLSKLLLGTSNPREIEELSSNLKKNETFKCKFVMKFKNDF